MVARARKGEPQLVLRRGKKAVVVLDWETYARLTGEEASVLEALRPPKTLPNEEVEALFNERLPIYSGLADITMNNGNGFQNGLAALEEVVSRFC